MAKYLKMFNLKLKPSIRRDYYMYCEYIWYSLEVTKIKLLISLFHPASSKIGERMTQVKRFGKKKSQKFQSSIILTILSSLVDDITLRSSVRNKQIKFSSESDSTN